MPLKLKHVVTFLKITNEVPYKTIYANNLFLKLTVSVFFTPNDYIFGPPFYS